MKLEIKIENDQEKLSNFSMAEAIYDLCTAPTNALDVSVICEMLRSQYFCDKRKGE